MPFDGTEWVWINGRLVRWGEAAVHVSAHALHYGSGVFEGIRCYETELGPALFRLDAHLERFYASAAACKIEIPYDRDQLWAAICETILRNGLSSCYVRPICYYGSSVLSLHPRSCPVEVAIMAWPWETYLGAAALEEGVRVAISSWRRIHGSMIPTVAKACGSYVNSVLATREAAERGFDEALLLDVDGRVAEGAGENLFIVRDGKLLTNDERSSILLGITRDTVIRIAEDLGYEVQIGEIWLEDLISADEAFLTGTAAEVTPIRQVEDRTIGRGRRGAVTERIQAAFFAAVSGKEPKYRSWLHFLRPQ